MNLLENFRNHEFLLNSLASAFVVLGVFLLRNMLMGIIRKAKTTDPDVKRQWIVQTRNISTLIVIIGLLLIWATKLQAFALSVVAIAAAIVIATKELLSCLLGGFLKLSTSMFKIGDRIEINGIRGDVLGHGFFTTTVMEVGPSRLSHQYTGKKVIIPNSYFLIHSLINDTRTDKYRLHTFVVTCPRDIEPLSHKRRLLSAAKDVCEEFSADAESYLKGIESFDGIEAPSTEPRVHISLNTDSGIDFIVRVPIPALKSAKIEQEILTQYLSADPI